MKSPTFMNNKYPSAGLALLLLGSAAFGDTVFLSSTSASTDISVRGNLLKFDGSVYVVRTAIGDIEVEAEHVTCDGDACPQPRLFMGEPVDLQSDDGALSLSGTLMAYANGSFKIDTHLGDLFVDAAQVRCSGAGCPDGASPVLVASIAETSAPLIDD